MKIFRLILPFLLFVSAHAQTQIWFTVAAAAQQATTLTISLPSGATYRIGDAQNNKWSDPLTTKATTSLIDYADGVAGRPSDPDPGTPKEFDVLETALPQTVVLTDTSVQPSKMTVIPVPALPIVSMPPPPVTTAPTTPSVVAVYTCTITAYSDGSFQSSNCTAVSK